MRRVTSSEISAAISSDFLPVDQIIEFAPGQTDAVLPLTLIDDNIFELTESFSLSLSELTNVRADLPQVEVQVVDDDLLPRILVSADPIGEGEQGVVTFDLNGVSSLPISVAYELHDGTATQGEDFAELKGTLSFAPGEMRKAYMCAPFLIKLLNRTKISCLC